MIQKVPYKVPGHALSKTLCGKLLYIKFGATNFCKIRTLPQVNMYLYQAVPTIIDLC